MKILVTGGAGYIGSHTVVELVAAGHQPVIVDNFSNSERGVLARLHKITGKKIPFYEINCEDKTKLKEVLQKEQPTALIHFAAFKAVSESVEQPIKYYKNNVMGFMTVLEAAVTYGVTRVVFSSTAAIYGTPRELKVTEDFPAHPESPYGWSKYMDEVVLRDYCASNQKVHGTVLRYFNVVGAHESGQLGESPLGKPQNLLPIIVQVATGRLPELTVFGDDYATPDGTCLRDYIHVVDLAKAHVAALEKTSARPADNFSTYNVGTGKATSVFELLKTFERVNKITVPYVVGKRRAGDPSGYYAAPDKANKLLGWKTDKTIEDAVRDVWRWTQQNPHGYS